MNKNISILIYFIFLFSSYAQNETANWYFGENAGLTFNSGFPNPDLNGQISTTEGCSTISNKQGQLLFYSDGITVWNKNHQVMPNGNGLTGDDSSTQSAIIIPKPNSSNFYYIFTVDARAGVFGLRYTEVNMNSAGGLGAVTANKNILLEASTTEKITAVESADGESIWVIGHKWESNEFISFLVDASGVNITPVISPVGSFHGGDTNNTIGYLKASPNRGKVACVKSYINNEVQLFDFNAATGILSNPITIDNFNTENLGPYGCEFSSDSRLLYVTEINRDAADFSRIHQYDITQNSQQAIINSDIIITEEPGILGALQQALDGRIYVAKSSATSICVIKKPNDLGLNCDYESEAISLDNKISRLGLPPFIQSYFFATNLFENTCFGETTLFSIDTSTTIDSINWNFGDPASGPNNNSTDINTSHIYTAPGTYNITITVDTNGETQLIYRTLTITDQPPVMQLNDLITCASNNSILEFDLTSNIPPAILNNSNFSLSFFETLGNAQSGENAISSPSNYTTSNSQQSIFVKLDNINGDCFSVSEMRLTVLNAPEIETYEEVFFCDEGTNSTTIDVGILPMPYSNYKFLWLDSNETTPEIQVQSAGNYTVRITENNSISSQNPNGCFVERIIVVNSSSIATINDISVNNSTATVIVSGLGNYEFALDNENGVFQNSNSFTDVAPGVHTIFVNDKNNCGIVHKDFSVIGFPLYFTPNGDRNRDTWHVYGLSKKFQKNSLIYIYDRFGKLITQLKANGPGWDGTLNGKPLPQSDYWFSVTLEDGRTYTDHFTLKR